MILFDANILIYSYRDEYSYLRNIIFEESTINAISAISILEIIGYTNISIKEEAYHREAIKRLHTFNIEPLVIIEDTRLKRIKKMSIGDAIIAATALLNNFTLYTRNTNDYNHIPYLKLINPIDK